MKGFNIVTVVLASTLIGLTSCGTNDQNSPSIKIFCEGNATEISIGEQLQFTAKIEPLTYPQKVEWSVINLRGQADISDTGLLIPLSEGTVEVVATSYLDSSLQASYPINIKASSEIVPTEIKVNENVINMTVGESREIIFDVLPSDASRKVEYKNFNKNIIEINEQGIIKALSKGEAYIEVVSALNPNIKDKISIVVFDTEYFPDWSEIEVSTHEDFMNAKDGTPLKIRGVCKAKTSLPGATTFQAYLLNEKGGFYLYGLEDKFVMEIGKTYEVCGKKHTYSFIPELKDVHIVKELDKKINFVETDISNRDFSNTKNFNDVMGGKTLVKNAVLENYVIGENQSINATFSIGDNKVILYAKNIWFQDNDYINLEHFFQNITVGRAYDLSGLAESYGIDTFGRIQLKMISSKDIKESIINKDDLIHFAKNALKLKSCLNLDENHVELPDKLKGFEGISIKWITPDGIINENGEVIRPEKTTDTTLTAILNDGLQSVQKDFEITIVGNEQVNVVHTFDLEDAKPGEHAGSCLDKPYYSDPNKTDDVTLGNPKLTWNLKNTIISATRHDTVNGHFALSGRYDNPANLEEDRQVRIELKSDYNFTLLNFLLAFIAFFQMIYN